MLSSARSGVEGSLGARCCGVWVDLSLCTLRLLVNVSVLVVILAVLDYELNCTSSCPIPAAVIMLSTRPPPRGDDPIMTPRADSVKVDVAIQEKTWSRS